MYGFIVRHLWTTYKCSQFPQKPFVIINNDLHKAVMIKEISHDSNPHKALCFLFVLAPIKGQADVGNNKSEVRRREDHNTLRLMPNKQKTLIISSLQTPWAHRCVMFTWHGVNSTSDCGLLLCISFVAVPRYTYISDLFPPLISPITFRAVLPTVSFITANILNHPSCVSHQFGARSPLNRSHLNVPVLIAGAGGNTLRDWDSQWRSAERPLSICTKFPLTFGDMSF